MDKNKIMHEPVQHFRPGLLSSEFIKGVAILAILWGLQFVMSDMDAWAIALTIVAASFAIGRGIFKKSRLAYVGKGERTTEFWVILATQVAIAVAWRKTGMMDGIALICIASCEAGYQFSRGIGKSFIPRDVKLPHGLGG